MPSDGPRRQEFTGPYTVEAFIAILVGAALRGRPMFPRQLCDLSYSTLTSTRTLPLATLMANEFRVEETSPSRVRLSLPTKIFLNVLGTFFVFLGVLGAILPLLPATPFLLLASACYVRSSERLYTRLITNRYLGPYILNFKERRGLPIRIKVYSIILLWGSLLFSAYRLQNLLLTVTLVAVGVGVSLLIWSIKTFRE